VLDGEVECTLREMFQKTEPPHEMPSVAGSHMFGYKNTDMLVAMMMSDLKLGLNSVSGGLENVSGKCYLCMSVLLPELVAKMMMDMYKCNREEAAEKMLEYSRRLSAAMAADALAL
jgi:hypothetical protein